MSTFRYPSKPSDQLKHIVEKEKGFISQHSDNIKQLENGIECYFVEVTSRNGNQYGILAHGPEAKELYQLTMRILDTGR